MMSDVVAFGQDGDNPMIILRECQTVPLRGTQGQASTSTPGKSLNHVHCVPNTKPDMEIADNLQLERVLGILPPQQATDPTVLLGRYVSLFAHKHSALDILEYKPSTGGLLAKALTSLPAEDNIIGRMSSCVLAGPLEDTSSSGPSSLGAWEQLIQHRKLDLSQDPSVQDFNDSTYDIVVLDTAVEHDGDCLTLLKQCKKLLKP
jgi:hypothetical protein